MNIKELRRRTVEIDYTQGHRHLGGSLSALGIMCRIFDAMTPCDVFILSKGHAAPAYYAVLESLGHKPDISNPHPDFDPANGIPCTTGSLGHGLPIAVGIALAKKMACAPGRVFVLMGDGETLEGTTWESLLLADHLGLHDVLSVHVDANGWQGSCKTICDTAAITGLYPVTIHETKRGDGVRLFEENQDWHTHTITAEEYKHIMEELK